MDRSGQGNFTCGSSGVHLTLIWSPEPNPHVVPKAAYDVAVLSMGLWIVPTPLRCPDGDICLREAYRHHQNYEAEMAAMVRSIGARQTVLVAPHYSPLQALRYRRSPLRAHACDELHLDDDSCRNYSQPRYYVPLLQQLSLRMPNVHFVDARNDSTLESSLLKLCTHSDKVHYYLGTHEEARLIVQRLRSSHLLAARV